MYGPGFEHKESLYKFTARLVFENAAPYLRSATVILDRTGDRWFRDELARYLRQRVRDPEERQIIGKVKTQASKGNNLLQLADYIVGVVNRLVLEKPDAEFYHRMIEAHEVTRRVWPGI